MTEFERQLEKTIDYHLEQMTLEEFLEEFNVTPFDIILCAFNGGLLDEEVLKSYMVCSD